MRNRIILDGMKRKIFLDTSVIGGFFDDEFSFYTNKLFMEIQQGIFIPVASDITILELEKAPEKVQRKYAEIKDITEIIGSNRETEILAEKYMQEGKFSRKYLFDT